MDLFEPYGIHRYIGTDSRHPHTTHYMSSSVQMTTVQPSTAAARPPFVFDLEVLLKPQEMNAPEPAPGALENLVNFQNHHISPN
jgi:hypothetical protein